MLRLAHEQLNPNFDKWHIEGLPLPATIHCLRADEGLPHDHPWNFTTHILAGGYVEEVFTPQADGSWTRELVERLPGTSHDIAATHIHKIVAFPNGPCWTVITTGPAIRESRVWRFDEQGVASKVWSEDEFTPLAA